MSSRGKDDKTDTAVANKTLSTSATACIDPTAQRSDGWPAACGRMAARTTNAVIGLRPHLRIECWKSWGWKQKPPKRHASCCPARNAHQCRKGLRQSPPPSRLVCLVQAVTCGIVMDFLYGYYPAVCDRVERFFSSLRY